MLPEPLEQTLRAGLDGELLTDALSCERYASSASICYLRPLAIVRPQHARDVVTTVSECADHGVPVTARGASSSLAGQSLGPGVILDFAAHMTSVVRFEPERRLVRVQPGIARDALNRWLQASGLFFPPNPSSSPWATIGGMIANNSGGTHSFKYGTTKHWIHELKLVLADGREVTVTAPYRADLVAPAREAASTAVRSHRHQTRTLDSNYTKVMHADALGTGLLRRFNEPDAVAAMQRERPTSARSSCGYNVFEAVTDDAHLDVTRLIAGSEGTLALIVEAALRLAPLPKHRMGFLAYFASPEAALRLVPLIAPHNPGTIQVLDRAFIDVVARELPDLVRGLEIPDPLAYLMLVEFEGDDLDELNRAQADCLDTIAAAPGDDRPFRVDADDEHRARLVPMWAIRSAAAPILSRAAGPRPTRWVEDGAVAPEKLAEFFTSLKALLAARGMEALTFGHAGEGLLHLSPRIDRHRADYREVIGETLHAHAVLTRQFDGVPSGEHGDGLLRTPVLPDLFPATFPLMVDTKRAFDPRATLNPLVIVPARRYAATDHLRHGAPQYQRATTGTVLDDPALADKIELCHGCGKCITYCPIVGDATDGFAEERTPRAKANLLRGALAGLIDARDVLGDASTCGDLGACATCGKCLTDCPTAVDLPAMAAAVLQNDTGA